MNETAKSEILRALTDAYGPDKAEQLMTQFAASRRDELAWDWLMALMVQPIDIDTPEVVVAFSRAEAFIAHAKQRPLP